MKNDPKVPAGSKQTPDGGSWTRNPVKLLVFFVVVSLFYTMWMTGGTFHFVECTSWPNYNSLARSLANGRLDLVETGVEDFVLMRGNAYLYSGPVPALLRLPFELLFHRGIPTGLMIVLFCAGVNVFFVLTLDLLAAGEPFRSGSRMKTIFTAVMMLNGVSLFMVLIPSFHHEAIASGMFFLTASLYFFFRTKQSRYCPTTGTAVLLGLSMALSMGSRLSYALSLGLLGVVLTAGTYRTWRSEGNTEPISRYVIVLAITGVSAGLLLAYNYARYGSPFETGMTYQMSNIFADYYRQYACFRYDHIPHNLWSYFFRIPRVIMDFPFIALPAFTWTIDSIQFIPHHQLYRNELSVSMFSFMPILLLMFCPVVSRLRGTGEREMGDYWILFGVFSLQILTVSLVPSTTIRYYYDFIPVATLMAYLGGLQVSRFGSGASAAIVCLAVASIILGLALPFDGVLFYRQMAKCVPPLGNLFFGIFP